MLCDTKGKFILYTRGLLFTNNYVHGCRFTQGKKKNPGNPSVWWGLGQREWKGFNWKIDKRKQWKSVEGSFCYCLPTENFIYNVWWIFNVCYCYQRNYWKDSVKMKWIQTESLHVALSVLSLTIHSNLRTHNRWDKQWSTAFSSVFIGYNLLTLHCFKFSLNKAHYFSSKMLSACQWRIRLWKNPRQMRQMWEEKNERMEEFQ